MPQKKLSATMLLVLSWAAAHLRPDTEDTEVGGVGEYAALVGLGVAAVVAVFAVYNGWLSSIMDGLPNP